MDASDSQPERITDNIQQGVASFTKHNNSKDEEMKAHSDCLRVLEWASPKADPESTARNLFGK